MHARLRQRLEDALRDATGDWVATGRLRAELAGLLARQGEIEQARRDVASLRARFRAEPDVGVSAWLSLAEGLIGYHDKLDTGCRDKLLRAYSLSAAARLRPLQALSAAWLALLDYVEHDGDAMEQRLRQALALSTPEDHGARARACLVAAQGYHWGGRMDRAQPWYHHARQHALAEGDEAMMSAILFNRFAIEVNLQRETEAQAVVGLREPLSPEDLARQSADAARGAESTERFDRMVGTSSLSLLHPLMQAQLLTIQGRADEALALFSVHFEAGLAQGLQGRAALLLADMARCEALRGQGGRALERAGEAELGLAALDDPDDRAAARCRLIQVYQDCGDEVARQRGASHHSPAADHWRALLEQQTLWVARLDRALGAIEAD